MVYFVCTHKSIINNYLGDYNVIRRPADRVKVPEKEGRKNEKNELIDHSSWIDTQILPTRK